MPSGDAVSAPTPRLLTELEARAYLANGDPHKLCQPIKLGGKVRWDRVALDRRLNELQGLPNADTGNDDTPDAALAGWKKSRASGGQ